MHTITRRQFVQACSMLALGSAKSAALAQPGGSPPELLNLPAQAVTRGPRHHFYGYYDKCPWSANGRYLLAHEIAFCDRQPRRGESITVGMIDLRDQNRFIPLDRTAAWCWQQGSMLQWHPADPNGQVIYNSVADNRYVTILRDVSSGRTRTLPLPVHYVRSDGKQAITLDYDRLHRLRPGYGYDALPETLADDPAPESRGISTLDLETGATRLIVSLAQLAATQPDERFPKAQHFINHMQYNPCGDRFLFLHRWAIPGSKTWHTRMFVARPDGTDLRLISDTGMVSHFDWRDDRTILAWARSPQKLDRFLLHDVNTGGVSVLGEGVFDRDGHCSFSPDRQWMLNDTYPDRQRLQTLMLYRWADGKRFDLNRFFSPPMFVGPIRCDLHPRFNRDGTQICIDSTHEGSRQIYVLDVRALTRPA